MTDKLLGLDIDDRRLLGMVVERSRKCLVICQAETVVFSEMENSSSGHGDRDDTIISPVGAALERLCQKLDITGCTSAAICLPSSWAVFRQVSLPFRSMGKIRQVLDLELASDLPLSDQVYLTDFMVLPKKGDEGGARLLTASIPEDRVDSVFGILSEFRIRPALITCSGYVSAAYLSHLNKEPVSAEVFIDQSGSETTVSLAVGGRIVLVRTASRRVGSSGALDRFVGQTLKGYALKQGSDMSLERCSIISYRNRDDALATLLAERLQCEVGIVDLETLGVKPNGHDPVLHMNAYACCDGLIRGRKLLSFCQDRFSSTSRLRQYLPSMLTTAAFALAAFIMFMGNVYSDISVLRKEVNNLDKAAESIFLDAFPGTRTVVDPLMQMKAQVKEIRASSEGSGPHDAAMGAGSPAKTIDILSELSRRIPKDVEITVARLMFNANRVLLSGSTDTFNTVDRVKGLIEGADMFTKVTINSAAADKTGNRIRFQFVIDF